MLTDSSKLCLRCTYFKYIPRIDKTKRVDRAQTPTNNSYISQPNHTVYEFYDSGYSQMIEAPAAFLTVRKGSRRVDPSLCFGSDFMCQDHVLTANQSYSHHCTVRETAQYTVIKHNGV